MYGDQNPSELIHCYYLSYWLLSNLIQDGPVQPVL